MESIVNLTRVIFTGYFVSGLTLMQLDPDWVRFAIFMVIYYKNTHLFPENPLVTMNFKRSFYIVVCGAGPQGAPQRYLLRRRHKPHMSHP